MRIILISTAYHAYVHAFAYPIEGPAEAENGTPAAQSEAQSQAMATTKLGAWLASLTRRSEAGSC